ncbi:DNA processing Smf single strand binding protein-like protein [Paenibacillus larvae subsp. larvae DSM 25430]|uniref:DNA processing Smf single strand binding protein-like protein n=1 Tax=Paenibacillus larvae subsp. larvae DSM 25430 TaxID=697284 RepID=V9W748_9BACL|nr:DNA processing Smf single strand binding protein-like protein [Paenibacillus larvae subsp. larvae DSM 25430]AVG12510.1 DNA processing Smf single strand binding protein-like protein [Paenibacillus larvae subsp. larvae DSM 25430]
MCPNIILTEGYEYGSFHFLEPSFLHNYTDSTGIGMKTIAMLHQKLDDLTVLQTCTQKELIQLGLTEKQASSFLAIQNKGIIDKRLAFYEKQDIQILTVADPDYPNMLKQIYQPPWVLYAIGDLSILGLPMIGIVGTRKPTPYGKKVTEQLAASLVQRGIGIVSGMARGIDSSAHRGALQVKGKTVAVLGGPADKIYPPENGQLYRQIAESGLILSEVPVGTPIHPGCFPLRNRIISGISLGIVELSPYNCVKS